MAHIDEGNPMKLAIVMRSRLRKGRLWSLLALAWILGLPGHGFASPPPPIYRDCSLATLGKAPITAVNQTVYAFCLVLGENRSVSDPAVVGWASRLASPSNVIPATPQNLVGSLFNNQDFLARYPVTSMSPAEFVPFVHALLLNDVPTPEETTQEESFLAAGNPRQRLVDWIVAGAGFAAGNPILRPSLQPMPLSATLQRAPLGRLTWGSSIRFSASVPSATTTQGQLFVAAIDGQSRSAAAWPIQAYFRAGETAEFTWERPLPSLSPGSYDLKLGLRDSLGHAQWLADAGDLSIAPLNPPASGYAVRYNVSYGPDPIEVMDLVTPPGTGQKRPGVLFIHGGGLSGGDKFGYFGNGLVDRWTQAGFVVANINYRLARLEPLTSEWPAQLQDAQLAVRWLRAQAADLGLDPTRLCAMGDSAGAQLALFLGSLSTTLPGDRAAIDSGFSPQVACVIDEFGPANLTNPAYADLSAYPLLFGGGTLTQYPALYRSASPIFAIGPATVPTFVTQGTHDRVVPYEMSETLVAVLTARGIRNEFVSYDGDHEFIGLSGPARAAIWAQELAFARSVLGSNPM
jgi:acetyl esterase/lipase